MALSDFTVNGTIDIVNDIIVPNNTSTWDDLTTWDSWSSWTGTPADPLVWITEPLDLGLSGNFNLNIETLANGTVSYSVFTSNTGQFQGEETQYDIDSGDTGISSFNGQYVVVVVKVQSEGALNTIEGITIRANNRTIQLKLNDIDTSTLGGDNTARVLTTDRSVSSIINMQITPKTVSAYDLDLYVSSTRTSTTVVPRIIDKDALTFSLVGLDNQPRDAVVDIVLEGLPEQYMDGNSLRSR